MTEKQPDDADLPLDVIDQNSTTEAKARPQTRKRRVWIIPLLMLLMFAGGVVAIYFQPHSIRAFFAMTGLQPGGGADEPFVVPVGVELSDEVAATLQPTDVVGLARLLPQGDISVVAPPFGAADARIADVLVSVGEEVHAGQDLALMDNLPDLSSVVATAQANLAVRQATLLQTRHSVALSIAEDKASLAEAQAVARVAETELERTQSLFDRGITTQALLDQAISVSEQANRAVERARATLQRSRAEDPEEQPDVLVAKRNVDAALAELRRAELDLGKGTITAPTDGTVLDIYARPGEAPGSDGVMVLGAVEQMMAEIEVHQTQIINVRVGQPVELLADALNLTFRGTVRDIGLMVRRQDIVADDTAANTDARVIEVLVALDAASSEQAARFTNLEVVARIDTRGAGQ